MIAVVVPTMPSREEVYGRFLHAWEPLFKRHSAHLVTVLDGDEPAIMHQDSPKRGCALCTREMMGENYDLICNHNDGVRNAGFYYVASRMPEAEIILTFDDDVLPDGDTIQDHLTALEQRVPVSWLSTASEYMRGFPYEVREEAEVVLSHGVWEGVKDWDAPTQLVIGNRNVTFYRGPIPKGVYYPMCGMNIAFKRKLLPYMYFAPMGPNVGLDRFADIWCGIESKRAIDRNGWAVFSGYATVIHDRASDVWKNLQKESRGLALNEGFWKGEADDPYFVEYRQKREKWEKVITQFLEVQRTNL